MENNCYYPASMDDIKTNSKNDEPHPDLTSHGRPQCLPIQNGLTNGEFLDGYHNCMRAGCYSDASEHELFSNLVGVASTHLPPHLHQQFFSLLLSGHARSDNYRFIFDQMLTIDTVLQLHDQAGFPEGRSATKFAPSGPLTLNTNSGDSSVSSTQVILQAMIQNSSNPPPETEGKFGTNLLGIVNINTLLSTVPRLLPPCPYQVISWPNFPPLLGRFDGCCEASFCYLPRSVIKTAHSEIASYNTTWSPWGQCSVTCGLGTQIRRKFCIGELCGNVEESEERPCIPGPCPIRLYSPWSTYGSCDVTCGGGVRVRQRSCTGECERTSQETVPCNTNPCPVYSPWSSYGSCNVTCGGGVKVRQRSCSGDCEENLTETVSCNTEPCPTPLYSSWSSYGSCDATCGGGLKIRRRECMRSGECKAKLIQAVQCNTGRCPTIRYGQWTRCSKSCGFGIQRRPIRCEHPGDYGCPSKSHEQRKCERFCGHMRYLASRCNLKTCLIVQTSQCVQGNGRPGHCRLTPGHQSTVTKKCYEGRCNCFHYPNRSECKRKKNPRRRTRHH